MPGVFETHAGKTAPEAPWMRALFDAMHAWANSLGCPLVGELGSQPGFESAVLITRTDPSKNTSGWAACG